jgi:hypothetical protein
MTMKTTDSIHFPTTYQESRQEFREHLEVIKAAWPSAILDRRLVSKEEDLSIDCISTDAVKIKERLMILSTGLHGVEGFVGAAMAKLFVQEYLPRLDPNTTGLLLIHAINPWGMQHQRRVNSQNVDLNRNFMADEADFTRDFNPAYRAFNSSLNPQRPIYPLWLEGPGFIIRVLVNLARAGVKDLRGAILLGQQSHPHGLYFSGREYQVETRMVMDLIRQGFSDYRTVLCIDMHTGYGPRYQMSLVNSPAEPRRPPELEGAFHYPRILQADPDQFYSMQGDMIDWAYRLGMTAFPAVRFYGTAFEFGTIGEGIPDEIKSLRVMIFENQFHWHAAHWERTGIRVKKDLMEMYLPSEDKWREKALQDCRQALDGVLAAEGFLP